MMQLLREARATVFPMVVYVVDKYGGFVYEGVPSKKDLIPLTKPKSELQHQFQSRP